LILETARLNLREIQQTDYSDLAEILQDDETMLAYEGAFTNEEVQQWLDRQRERYTDDGFGLWAVILKETNQMIGQCGLSMQDANGKQVLEIGYLFNRAYWHKGYASEAAIACKEYAFTKLNADEVFSIIRDTNTASQNVALRNRMVIVENFVKHYRGVDMPHYLFSVKRV
jgi:RimJ/RimL family protein N-acetyltransferase